MSLSPFTVCLFCSASSRVEPVYLELARFFGAHCADQGWHLVYGGAQGGLMGAAADAALNGGGTVTGVLPKSLEDKERAHTGLSDLIITDTLHTRQQEMADRSDAFVVLPGGLGTLAEFFEVLTWKQIGLHDKPIVLVNAREYWTPLLKMLSEAQEQNFMHGDLAHLFEVVESIDDIHHHLLKQK